MNLFLLDASALAKRYVPEIGTDRLLHLFQHAVRQRLYCLLLTAAEVVSVLVRQRNGGRLSVATFRQGMLHLHTEVVQQSAVTALSLENTLIETALPLINTHSINSNDAVVLQTALNLTADCRAKGDDLILVVSDQRLLRAAIQEGLVTFNPETQDIAALKLLLAVP